MERAYNYPALWDAYLAKQNSRSRYTSIRATTIEFFIEREAMQLYSILRANKQPAELRIVNGAHVWAVWESTIGDAMRNIFRFSARPATPARRHFKRC